MRDFDRNGYPIDRPVIKEPRRREGEMGEYYDYMAGGLPVSLTGRTAAEAFGVLYGMQQLRQLSQSSVDAAVNDEVQRRRIEREVQAKLALIDAFGEDNYNDGDVVTFTKVFATGGTEYKYAAIKTNGHWYTTGPKSPKNYTWGEFVAWLVSGDVPTTKLTKMIPLDNVLQAHDTAYKPAPDSAALANASRVGITQRYDDDIPF